MPDITVALAIGGGLIGLGMFIRKRMDDSLLSQRLASVMMEARHTLPAEDLRGLTHTLQELRATAAMAELQGMSARRSMRMAKEAALHTIMGFLELNRMLPVPAETAPSVSPHGALSASEHRSPEYAARRADLARRINAMDHVSR